MSIGRLFKKLLPLKIMQKCKKKKNTVRFSFKVIIKKIITKSSKKITKNIFQYIFP